jgi:hypothetical protein
MLSHLWRLCYLLFTRLTEVLRLLVKLSFSSGAGIQIKYLPRGSLNIGATKVGLVVPELARALNLNYKNSWILIFVYISTHLAESNILDRELAKYVNLSAIGQGKLELILLDGPSRRILQ